MAIYKDVASLEVVGYTPPENGTFADGVQFILEKLDAIPEADVEPVRHAHWIRVGNGYDCSECKYSFSYYENIELVRSIDWSGGGELFCQHCGAKMDGKEK